MSSHLSRLHGKVWFDHQKVGRKFETCNDYPRVAEKLEMQITLKSNQVNGKSVDQGLGPQVRFQRIPSNLPRLLGVCSDAL